MSGRPRGWRTPITLALATALLATGGTVLAVAADAPSSSAAPSVAAAGGDRTGHDDVAGGPAVDLDPRDLGPHDHGSPDHHHADDDAAHTHDCGPGSLPLVVPGAPPACAHSDAPPRGVDVTAPVATAVLEARAGAVASAVHAAEDAGVPSPATLATTTDRVACDGDGTSGYRVQAIYAVTADRTNRYASVADQIRQWSAGVTTVFNRSAAKTGGIRDVRFVTATNADGTCSPTVLNVTLPAGSTASFGATINALSALGYTSPARKYLVWTDTTGLCGIATTYLSSTPGQDNPNNGAYPQVARIDTPCWGHAQSVEAHELAHTMGSVQRDAPHATSAGHCFDESDRMCYADGGGRAMQQICPADQEPLLDCNDDDYFSTYPPAGSYLATHWNTASSRFLIGGGDGSGGGTPGVPTRLGGILSVNNPAVAGLPTQAQITVELPPGRTSSTTWSTTRRDCVFSAPAAEQTTVTCDAPLTTSVPVTATVVDSAGERLVRTGTVTFAAGTRPATAAMGVDTSTAGTYAACPGGKAVLTATVLDRATGGPVKGALVSWVRTSPTGTSVKVAGATTTVAGTATSPAVTMAAGTLTAVTTTSSTFPTVTSAPVTVTVAPSACATALTAAPDTTEVPAGAPVTVTGVLTRVGADGRTVPVAGETLTVLGRAAGATTSTSLATTTPTGADGRFSVVVRPVTSTALAVSLRARPAYAASSSGATAVTVRPWTTSLTVQASPAAVDAGAPVTVSGTLQQTDGDRTVPFPSQAVAVTYPVDGTRTATVTVASAADGTFRTVVRPVAGGTVSARYTARPGWSGATASAELAVRQHATAVTLSASTRDAMAGSPLTLTGTVTQTGSAGTAPLAGAPVVLSVPAPGGTTSVTATTNAAGTFTTTVRPVVGGSVTARYAGKPGWAGSVATPVALTVREWGTAVTATSSAASVVAGGSVTLSGTATARDSSGAVRPMASVPIAVTYQATATRTAVLTVRTTSSGTWTATVRPGASGAVVARFAATPGWAGSQASVTVSVR